MFVDNLNGILIDITEDQQSQYEYKIWFPYTKKSINTLREGSLAGVKNFASTEQQDVVSIIQITSVLPMHYALGNDRSGYPAFVEEAAISAAQDWLQEDPTEDTTKIVCKAIPTNFEIRISSALFNAGSTGPIIQEESNIPMLGEKVKILNSEWMGNLVNRGLSGLEGQTMAIGSLQRSPDIEVLTLWEDLVRMHFGIFAFTNAGKSNLLSTCVAKMLERSNNLKAVIYDLMSEYPALLIDKMINMENSCLVCLTRETVPASVLEYFHNEDEDLLARATRDLVNTTLLPKALKQQQRLFDYPFRELLRSRKIKLFIQANPIDRIIEEEKDSLVGGIRGNDAPAFRQFVENLIRSYSSVPLSDANVSLVYEDIEQFRNSKTDAKGSLNLSNTIQSRINILRQVLSRALDSSRQASSIREGFKTSLPELVSQLNDGTHSSLFIMQSNLEPNLRQFAKNLGNAMFRFRRQSGQISPPVSFIFDEADSFIPQDKPEEEGQEESRLIAQQLARRGRKYGLGIAIATQRIVNLDTSVLGQPHTYFVSKLPRQTDRQRVQEAFGLSEETFRQTFRFKKGQWLLVSYDATGVEGLPIPITVPDANNRIAAFLGEYAAATYRHRVGST
jgi:DNA helicase HerA-like ATPase